VHREDTYGQWMYTYIHSYLRHYQRLFVRLYKTGDFNPGKRKPVGIGHEAGRAPGSVRAI